ncbi:MAG TPA: CheR family methyltransferase, partial [Clostridia bacterium]|nr:CheR family methyltransferase [Clostridia bacterium]
NLILRNYSSVDFSKYKKNTMVRRIDRRVLINRCHSIKEYIELLSESDEEKETLYKELLIGVTNFFRNKAAYESIKKNILPNLDYSKKEIRIWSAGCSTGEEAYSLTIMISEYLSTHNINCDIKCFATDIDEEALEVAGSGLYPESIVADLDSEIISKYFIKKEKGYQVNEFIRKKVVFAKHNLLNDPPFSRLDLLSCRNLFIYFKSEFQQQILRSFYYSLRDKGILFLGNSESLGKIGEAFDIIDSKWKIFRFKKGYQPSINQKLHVTSGANHLKTYEQKIIKSDRSMWYEQLLLKALQMNVPPSIIVDENDNIIQILGDVSKYMKIQPGRFSNKLSSNISKGLGLFVKNIIRRLKAKRESLVLNNINGLDDTGLVISIKGEIIEVNHNDYFYISFLEKMPNENKSPIEINMTEDEKDRIETLETELQQAREGLQATIEELETSNEELQSSNEELVASNEELQSTNEELQSVNEELYTVNNEHQLKIDELSDLNNDLNNLLKNTEVGALYLDANLCIRRTTPLFVNVSNILESDIGRSIAHISVMDEYPELNKDIKYVMEELDGVEREIKDKNGTNWLMRVRPFRTSNNAVSGVIVTMVDITKLKKQVDKTEMIKNRLEKILEVGKIAWWEYDLEMNYVEYSDSKANMLGYSVDEFPNDVYQICEYIHKEDFDNAMESMKNYITGNAEEWDIIYRLKRKDGTYSKIHDRGEIILRDQEGKPLKLVGTVQEIE